MKRNLSILVFLLIGLGLWACIRSTGDAPGNWIRLEITDKKTTLLWQRTGERFVSKQSKVILSLAEVAQMRLEMRRTSRGRQFFAREVGLTPESLRAHRDQILKSCDIDKLPDELEHCLDYEAVLKNARRLAFMDDLGEWAGQGITLVIDGTPQVRIKGRSPIVSFLQPSTLDYGGQSWETCSLSVIDAFTRMMEPDSEEYSMMARGRMFWTEDVWNNNDGAFEASIWGELAGEYQTFSDLPAFRKRPGYEELNQVFRIVSLWDSKDEFHVYLAPRKTPSIDLVDWSNKLNQPLPTLLPIYERCDSDILARHRWLLDWKSSRPGRAIQLKIESPHPVDSVRSQWRLAGIPGEPEFELELLDHERSCASVWLSSKAAHGLIPWATPKWQEGGSVNSPYESGEVIVVDGSGQLHRKLIGKSY